MIVLPTQRLEVYFLAELAKIFPAFEKPRIFSFEHFARNFLDSSDEPKNLLDDLACELILASLIKEKNYDSIMLGDEHELKQFFGEIIESGIEKVAFGKMRDIFREDIYSSEKTLSELFMKTDELEDLYRSFLAVLDSQNFLFKDAYWRVVSDSLLAQWKKEEDLPWKGIYFAGFTTLRSDFIKVADHLLSFSSTSFWVTKAPDLLSRVNPLKRLEESFSCLKYSRQSSMPSRVKNLFLKQAGTPLAEVLAAHDLAKEYCDAGCLPSKIGILVSSEETYASALRLVFGKSPLKTNLAVALKLSQTELGSWLTSFMYLTRKGQRKEDLMSFLIHPITFYCLKKLDEKDLLSQGGLSVLFVEDLSGKGFKKICERISHVEIQKILLAFYEKMKPWVEEFSSQSKKKSLKAWSKLIREMFSFFAVFSRGKTEEDELSDSLVSSAHQFVDALTLAAESYNPEIAADDVWDFLNKKILSLEVRSVGYPLEGVQVLRLIESRYIPFDVVMILGCVEGKFPKKLPKDYILDDWIKRKVGLRGWEYVESLEDTTYHLLKGRIPVLELFYPKTEKGRDLVPSRFLELEKSYKGLEAKVLKSKWDRFFSSEDQVESLAEPYQAQAENFFDQMSAKSSGFLLTCPYKFLLYSLKLEPKHFFTKTDHIEEGKILHKILEIFYKGCFEDDLKLAKLPKEIQTTELKSFLFERIKLITTQLFEYRLSRSLFYHLIHYSWPKFSEFFASFYKSRENGKSLLCFGESYRELSFGGQWSDVKVPSLTYGSGKDEKKVFFIGSIDSLDRAGSEFLLVDYKRKTVPTQKDQDTLKDIQLLFYALVHSLSFEDSDLEEGVCGYWSIVEGKWAPRSSGLKVDPEGSLSSLKLPKKAKLKEMTHRFREELLNALLLHRKSDALFEKKSGSHCDTCDYLHFCQPER